MKHLDLVIPTRNRLEKLRKCLDSIDFKKIDFSFAVIVVTDGDSKTATAMRADQRVNTVIEAPVTKRMPRGSVFCRNLGISQTKDGVSWGVDDVIYEGSDFFNRAFKQYNLVYPNDDGVLAFNVLNNRFRVRKPGQSLCGMGMVGTKWLSQYPERNLFYPGYFHFSCQEIVRLGKKLDKITFAPELKVYHLSPSAGEVVDSTHLEARTKRSSDMILSNTRKHEGYIWGDKCETVKASQ